MSPQRRSQPHGDPQQHDGTAAGPNGDGRHRTGDPGELDPAPPYRSLFEENPEPIVALDRERCIAELNPAAEAISGYRASELVGRPIEAIVAPRDRARVG